MKLKATCSIVHINCNTPLSILDLLYLARSLNISFRTISILFVLVSSVLNLTNTSIRSTQFKSCVFGYFWFLLQYRFICTQHIHYVFTCFYVDSIYIMFLPSTALEILDHYCSTILSSMSIFFTSWACLSLILTLPN